jgi:hypothetical protein
MTVHHNPSNTFNNTPLQVQEPKTNQRDVLHNAKDAQKVLGDRAWVGLVDLLDRAKMENLHRGVTVEQLLGWNEELCVLLLDGSYRSLTNTFREATAQHRRWISAV